MDYSELKNKTVKELHELLQEKRNELCALTFKVGEQQLKNVRQIRLAKKDIARISTELHKKITAN
ncbi:MAG: 50S ribosomal protein L29 [Candidatus Magasanikbacteria bacterium]